MAAGWRIVLAYLVYFGAIGASYPYLQVFYRDLGLTFEEIGVLTAIQAGTQLLLGPVWGGLVDRFPRVGVTLPAAASVATVGGFILFGASDFSSTLIGSMLLFAGLAGIGPTLDARTLETLGSSGRDRYGQARAFGSLGFVVAALLVGLLLEARESRSLFWVYLPGLIATVLVTATIPRRGGMRSVSMRRGAGQVLATPGIPLFFVGFTIVWTSLTAINAFYSIQVVALGGGTALVGITWAFGAHHRGPDDVHVPALRCPLRHRAAPRLRDTRLRPPRDPGGDRHRPGRARPDRAARGVRVHVRLRRRRHGPRGSSAGIAGRHGAGPVLGECRARDDRRLGGGRRDRRGGGNPGNVCRERGDRA